MGTREMMDKIKKIREGGKAEEAPSEDSPSPSSPWINDGKASQPAPVPTDNL